MTIVIFFILFKEKSMKKKILFTLLASGALILSGCVGEQIVEVGPLTGDYVANFENGEQEEMFPSDGWTNGGEFDAVWKKENITYSNGEMHLAIKDEEATVYDEEGKETTLTHTAGEIRSHKLYGYGDFEVRMKPTNIPGTVSTFFTYTDKWNSTNGQPNKHDEIDIEFLGKDTNKVQFNYFVGGQGGHEFLYNLGYDASKEFHNYGFRWEKNRISWLVDGKTVHQVCGDENTLPSMPGRIISSYWPHSPSAWSGTFDHATEDTVDYKWIKSSAPTSYADGEEPVEPIIPDEFDWDEVQPTDLTFTGGGSYTVNKENGISTITYNAAGGYANVMANIADIANKNDAVRLTLKNNGPTASTIRVDVQGTNVISTGTGQKDALNTNAYAEGRTDIYTDQIWGGSKFDLDPNASIDLVVEYNPNTEDIGKARNLLLFLDSLQDGSVAHEGGSVSVSNIKFAKFGDWTPEEPVDPVDPTDEFDWTSVTPVTVEFNADNDDYHIVGEDGVTTITYTKAGNWINAVGEIDNLANDYDHVNVTLKNNSATATNVRVDIQGTNKVGNTDALNVSAKAENHSEVRTDTSWGGSFITLAAAEEVEFIVEYDVTTTKGLAKNMLIYLDSMQGSETTKEDGSVTISKIRFAKLNEWDPVDPVDPIDPVDPGQDIDEGAWAEIDPIDLSGFWSSDATYSINTQGTSATITYTSAGSWACTGLGVGSHANGYTNAKITLKNNSADATALRIDIQSNAGNSIIKAFDIAQDSGYDNDYLYDGSLFVTVAGGARIDVVLEYAFDETNTSVSNLMFFIDSATGSTVTKEDGSLTVSNVKFASLAD